jgi:hypothetical protein
MAKNFPYFKFIATEWLTGDIVYEDFESQGLFINICALYWQRDGKLSIKDVNRRYKNESIIQSLSGRFFSVNDGLISINFLDEQLEDANHISKVNSENGKKGAEKRKMLATAKQSLSEPLANFSKEKKNKRKEEEEEINIKFDFKKSCISLGIELDIINDWLIVRKGKKASNTKTAFELIKLELSKTTLSANECIKIAVENSWSGFKSDWLKTINIPLNKLSGEDEYYINVMKQVDANKLL